MEWILLPLIGLLAGAVGSLIGLGGGVIVVPALLFFGPALMWIEGITPQTAVGISLVVMIFTGLSSTLAYLKTKTVDMKSGLLFFAGSGPGAVIGSYTNQYLALDSFHLYFGIFMIFLSLILLIRNKIKPIEKFKQASYQRHFTDPQGVKWSYGFPPVAGVLAAFAVGFASGLFGIGGGSVMVPVMIIAFLFPPHVAVGTSMLMVFLSALLGSGSHILLGNVDWLYAALLAPGAWFGAKLGAWMNQRLQSDKLVIVLRLILVLIGIRSIIEGLYG
ncbi:hypothetical protein KP77_25770 [Jeotgalibacillus alimentarius]|uniref:Probable membrane transporter protein n=1 Tax=Jeotgalibacillus alimentarius TaxID=135826 RepID=A0A0C2R8A8_9BACL|nr:sulfite exporter TauE/SafE family protein [Jeotgalibacillus alimentarius]KIL46450.1 hypothetical protein KP77_25770 [Jeotgalibacillus alimentarius]